MKKIFFALLIAVTSMNLSAYGAEVAIISDIDDTLLITHVEKSSAALWNTLKKSKSFGAMAELLNAYGPKTTVDYVSGSGKFLTNKLERFIEKYEFPRGDLHLMKTNEWLKRKTVDHKKTTIEGLLKEIASANDGRSVVFFGDNTEEDAVIYSSIAARFPGLIGAIYIHQVSPNPEHKEHPKDGATYYLTPIEVATAEIEAGRMTEGDAQRVAEAFFKVADEDFGRLFPRWSYCPTKLQELPKRLQEVFNRDVTTGPLLKQRREAAGRILSGCEILAAKEAERKKVYPAPLGAM